jgi:hypothetical protein
MWKDVYDLARLAGAFGAFQFAMPTTGLRIHRRAGDSVEEAAPHCKDPSRSPDPSTLRRWAHRRLFSVCCWLKAGAIGEYPLRAPTILAWDLGAVCRILPIEASSP